MSEPIREESDPSTTELPAVSGPKTLEEARVQLPLFLNALEEVEFPTPETLREKMREFFGDVIPPAFHQKFMEQAAIYHVEQGSRKKKKNAALLGNLLSDIWRSGTSEHSPTTPSSAPPQKSIIGKIGGGIARVAGSVKRVLWRSSESESPEKPPVPQKPEEKPWTEERVIALARNVEKKNVEEFEALKKVLEKAGAIDYWFVSFDDSQKLEEKEIKMVLCFKDLCRCCGELSPQSLQESARSFLQALAEYKAFTESEPKSPEPVVATSPDETAPQISPPPAQTAPPAGPTPPTPPPPPSESEEDIEPAEPVEEDAIETAELAEGESAFSRPKSLYAAKKRMKRALRSLWRRHAADEDVTPEIIKDALQHWFGDGVLSQEVLGRLCGPIQKGFLSADHTSANREISEILQSLFPAQPTPEQWWEHERKAGRWVVKKAKEIKSKIQKLFQRGKKPGTAVTTQSSSEELREPRTIEEARKTLTAFLTALESTDLATHDFVWGQIDRFFGKSIPSEFKDGFEWLAYMYCQNPRPRNRKMVEGFLEQIWDSPNPAVDLDDFKEVEKHLERALSGSRTFKEFGEAIQRDRDLNNIFTEEEIRQLEEIRRSREECDVKIQKLVEVLKAKNVVFELEGFIPKYIERLRAVFESLEGQQSTVENVTGALKTNEIDLVSQAEIPRIVELCTAHEHDRRNMDRILTDALVRMEEATPVDDDVIVDERIAYAEVHEAPLSIEEAIERVQMTLHILNEKHDAGISITSKVIEDVLTLCFGSGFLSPDVLSRLSEQIRHFRSNRSKKTRRAIFHQIKAILQESVPSDDHLYTNEELGLEDEHEYSNEELEVERDDYLSEELDIHTPPDSIHEASRRVAAAVKILRHRRDNGEEITDVVIDQVLAHVFGESDIVTPAVISALRNHIRTIAFSTNTAQAGAARKKLMAILRPLFWEGSVHRPPWILSEARERVEMVLRILQQRKKHREQVTHESIAHLLIHAFTEGYLTDAIIKLLVDPIFILSESIDPIERNRAVRQLEEALGQLGLKETLPEVIPVEEKAHAHHADHGVHEHTHDDKAPLSRTPWRRRNVKRGSLTEMSLRDRGILPPVEKKAHLDGEAEKPADAHASAPADSHGGKESTAKEGNDKNPDAKAGNDQTRGSPKDANPDAKPPAKEAQKPKDAAHGGH